VRLLDAAFKSWRAEDSEQQANASGGGYQVRVSLAATGCWLRRLSPTEGGLQCVALGQQQVEDLLDTVDSKFGEMTAVRHAAVLSETPAFWGEPQRAFQQPRA